MNMLRAWSACDRTSIELTECVLVTAAHQRVMAVEIGERQQVGLLHEQAQAESVVTQILIEAAHERAEHVPHLIVLVVLLRKNTLN